MTNSKEAIKTEINISKGSGSWKAETTILNINGYDWKIEAYKADKGIVCNAWGGKITEINTFSAVIFQDPIITLSLSKSRCTEKSISELIQKGIVEFYQLLTLGKLPQREVLAIEEIKEEAKIVEFAPKKETPTLPIENEEIKELAIKDLEFELIDYSPRSFAIFGETKRIKEQLGELGGSFNPNLKYKEEKKKGWIFSKKRRKTVDNFLASLKTDNPIEIAKKIKVVKSDKEAAKYFLTAERCNKSAADMTKKLDGKKANTPQRQREYNSLLNDRDITLEYALLYEAIGNAIKENRLPEILIPHISPKRNDFCFSYYVKGVDTSGGYYSCVRHQKYRFEEMNKEELRPVFEALTALTKGANILSEEQIKTEKIRGLENDLKFSKISGFFPTPEKEVSKMAMYAGIEKGDDVADLSAGKGDILEYVRENYDCNLFAAEKMGCLREILKLKEINLIGNDALKVTQKFDKILLNPPFEKGQDIAHVQYAFENNLKAGGTLVAILSMGSFSNSQKKFQAFQNWYVDFCEHEEEMIGAFKSAFRQTGVNTKMIVLKKEAIEEAEILIEEKAPLIELKETIKEVAQIAKPIIKEVQIEVVKAPKEAIIEKTNLVVTETKEVPLTKDRKAIKLKLAFNHFKRETTAKFGAFEPTLEKVWAYESDPNSFFWDGDNFNIIDLLDQVNMFDDLADLRQEYSTYLAA